MSEEKKYPEVQLELDDSQEAIVKIFMFEGALRERERIDADVKEVFKKRQEAAGGSSFSKTLTFDEVLQIVNGVELK